MAGALERKGVGSKGGLKVRKFKQTYLIGGFGCSVRMYSVTLYAMFTVTVPVGSGYPWQSTNEVCAGGVSPSRPVHTVDMRASTHMLTNTPTHHHHQKRK